ncbi:hypothetical protein GGR54DRAFT_38495 [Hypoxylon sp. NC1633]|nr:hypothetical protein GGR54DRAFT_38495 [Hypoxylon sp. NC1633]
MASILRLATLSYAAAWVDASLLLFRPGRDAGNWGPAKETPGLAEIDPIRWAPKPTAAPEAEFLDIDLRRRQRTTTTSPSSSSASTCGFPVGNSSAPAITCGHGEYCFSMQWVSAVGCCGAENRRDCRIPTTCVETMHSSSTKSDAQTLFCGNDPARPHCVTYLYTASFFDDINGNSFLACGEVAGVSTIATTPQSGWTPTSDITTASSTSASSSTGTDDQVGTVTVTVYPSDSPSSSTEPVVSAGSTSSANRTGAIVGGVIGGLAGLALIAAALLLFLRRRRRAERQGKEIDGSPPYVSRDFPAASVYPGGLPEMQYNSDFYGELPPQMAESSSQHITGYPPPSTDEPVAVPREAHTQPRPSTFVAGSLKLNEDDLVSPVSLEDRLNAEDLGNYTWISNPTPPPPPQSEYSQFSPPPPAHFQSYRPYPGT